MQNFVEVEIALSRGVETFHVELRSSRTDNEREIAPVNGQAQFDLDALRALSTDREEYGAALYTALFSDAAILAQFRKASTTADALEMPLRLQLRIDPTAIELNVLAWETLRDDSNKLLLTREDLLFSRFISSDDWRPVRLRNREALRALVLIANPTDLGGYTLAAVDVAGEEARARAGIGQIQATSLASGGAATLANMAAKLREGVDILYLVAHGAMIEGKPKLYLEDETGAAAVISGDEFVTRLSELQQRPRLVVLASCQSAGTGADAHSADEGALAALGPQLAQAGIPAVIAMQGNVAMETVRRFMPIFFTELERDGQIDRAMTAARGAIRETEDWWVPVLFMSLKRGRIAWYSPGFESKDQQGDFKRWNALVGAIASGSCTPILGNGLLEPIVGSFRDLARKLADEQKYPVLGPSREDLPLVAQFIAFDQSKSFARSEFESALRKGTLLQSGRDLPEAVQNGPVVELISAAAVVRQRQGFDDAHQMLAALKLPVYVSTNPDNLMADALLSPTCQPRVELSPRQAFDEDARDDLDYKPTPEQPLVFHLFGQLPDPTSVVLTQDDYFQFLIDYTNNKSSVPRTVRRRLTKAALLFLGFEISEWDFRVLFRSIMTGEGREQLKEFAHVAVQIDPERDGSLDPARAKVFLQRSFGTDVPFDIFWGSAEDFLKQLQQYLPQKLQWKPGNG